MRSEVLGHAFIEIWIGLSPDELDRNIKSLHLGNALSVSSDFLEELRRHLRERRAVTRLLPEAIVDERAEERLVIRLLAIRKSIQELLLLEMEQPGELLGTLQHSARERVPRRRRY
jgi:hypothetical protein